MEGLSPTQGTRGLADGFRLPWGGARAPGYLGKGLKSLDKLTIFHRDCVGPGLEPSGPDVIPHTVVANVFEQ